MTKIAGAVITFCRPDYLDQTLDSLERCLLSDKIDWFFFQDGLKGYPEYKVTYNTIKQKDIQESINRVRITTLPIKEHFINNINRGVNYQINSIFKLFNDYDKLFIFEDDMVVSKYYLRLLNVLSIEQPLIMSTFYSIGYEPNRDRDYKVMLKATKPRSWGFCLTREAWDRINIHWNKKYKNRFKKYRTPYYDTVITQYARKYLNGKYIPKISRGFYIGKDGILSYNKGNWNRRGLHKQVKEIEYDIDKNIKGFILK